MAVPIVMQVASCEEAEATLWKILPFWMLPDVSERS